MNVNVSTSWKKLIIQETKKDYWNNLAEKVDKAYKNNICYPKQNKIFNCFNFSNFEDTKVVIVGQDPYYLPNMANGLAFSVNKDNKLPKSLINIFKELKNSLNISKENGDLTSWAKQGVLLLNNCLSVEQNEPNSHLNFGWETFTTNIIKKVDQKLNGVIFVFWGNFAKTKINLLKNKNNYILTSSHPSPLSATKGFFGCQHFIKINNLLIKNNKKPIVW